MSARASTILVTGASGFVGRRVVEALQEQYRIVALDWRPPDPSIDRRHPNVRWIQADIADRAAMLRLARDVKPGARPDLVLHLAAHYEFEQVDEKPYWRTNVEGTRNVLEAAVAAGIPRFVFASSLAASEFPPPGATLDERSPPDAEHVYAQTKRAGEEMLREYEGRIQSVIVRFAAIYSDYCEYPPLYKFLETWLSESWNRRMLGGRGRSSIPFLHVRDAARFLHTVVARFDQLDDREVVIASPDGATSHRELFEVATEAFYGQPLRPIFIPRLLVRPGIYARMLLGKLTGQTPFERPWMADFVDREMWVDASRTRSRLGFAPRPRLGILERLPLLVDNFRAYPAEWHLRNIGALHKLALRPDLIIHGLIQYHRKEIGRRTSELLAEKSQALASYQTVALGDLAWNHQLALTQLMHAIRTRERKFFVDYCADLAARRHAQGFKVEELRVALLTLEAAVLEVIRKDPDCAPVERYLDHDVGMTVRFAIDEVEETFVDLEARRALPMLGSSSPSQASNDERRDQHRAVSESG
jgi:nucleoside-diphosphate-sugar epimerase